MRIITNFLQRQGSYHYEDDRLPIEILGLLRAITKRCRDVFAESACAANCGGGHEMFTQLDVSPPKGASIILNWPHSQFPGNKDLNADLVYIVRMMLPPWAKDFDVVIT